MIINKDYLLDIIKGRRSERTMRPEPIAAEDLDAVVEAALWAPSGSNQQPWHFAVVTNRELIIKMAAAVEAKITDIKSRINSSSAQKAFNGYLQYLNFFINSSALICCFAEPYRALLERLLSRYAPEISVSTRETASVQSVAAAIQNMLLTAHVLGLAACWTTGPLIAQAEIEAFVKPSGGDWSLLAVVALGAREPGKGQPKALQRRPRNETVSYYE